MALWCLLLLSAPVALMAYSAGRVGSYQGGCGGGGCHGAQSQATAVALNGPTTMRPGELGTYAFTVSHGNNGYAGFNASFRGAAGAAGQIMAGGNAQMMAGELTHAGRTQMQGGTATFNFTWTAPQQPGTYTFYAAGNAVNGNGYNDNGDVWNTTSVTITVTGATISAPTAGASMCVGSSLTINWVQSGFTNFRVEASSNNFVNTITIANSVAAAAGTTTWNIPTDAASSGNYIIRLVDAAGGQEATRTGAFSIRGAPVITKQPLSQSVCQSKTLALSVNAEAANAAYQWKKDGAILPGQSSAGLSISLVQPTDAGSYTCDVTSCNITTTSTAAVVTIDARPTITTQPVARTVCDNDTVSFSVEATGGGLAYQWMKNGTPIQGATSKVYKLTAKLVDDAKYSCTVRGTCAPDAESAEVALTVLNKVAVGTQPADRSVTEGETLTLTVAATGSAVTYQWKKGTTDIAGATSATYQKSNVVAADAGQYECVVGNTCNSITTRKAVVTILPKSGEGVLELSLASLALGERAVCAPVDTTVRGLLRNVGSSAITITGATTTPANLIEVTGLTFPLTIQPGAENDVRLKIAAEGISTYNGSVKFQVGATEKELGISLTTTNGLQVSNDTLTFQRGETSFERCVNIRGVDACAGSAIDIMSIAITGAGAGSYTATSVAPVSIGAGETFRLCITTTAAEGADALLVLTSSAGPRSVVLKRTDVVGVEEERAVAGMAIHPNPTSNGATITGLVAGTRVRITSTRGDVVMDRTVETAELVWSGEAADGSMVAAGSYIVQIMAGQASSAQLLHVIR